MAAVGNVIAGQNGSVITKYISASENFATYDDGDTVVGELTWEEPRLLDKAMLHCTRTVTLANGTNSRFAVDVLINKSAGTWRAMGLGLTNTGFLGGTFNGFSWSDGNTLCETGGLVAWSAQTTAQPSIGPVCYGVRLRITRNASDTTLAGTITNVWLSAAFTN